MSANRDALRALVARHSLDAAAVARLCRVSVSAVRAWLKSPHARSARAMPDAAIELLAMKLGEPSPFRGPR